MKTIKHYLKVYKILLRLNLDMLFSYRANFFNSALSNSVWAIFGIVAMLLLTTKVSTIFGWTRYELLIMAGVYNIVFSIFYMFFTANFGEFSNNIHFGKMDRFLVKPIDTQFLMTCTLVRYTQIIRLLLGVGFIIYILQQMHVVVTAMTVTWFLVFLVLSIIILYSLWMIVMTLTIWYTKLSNLVDLLYETHGIAKYPQEIYKGANQYLFFALFPLTLVVVFPTKAILNKIFLGDVLWPSICALVLFFIARKFWKFALRSYTSASG